MNDARDDHWLVRPRTIRLLWIGGCVVLAMTLLAELWVPIDGAFAGDGWFGFGAVFGFGVCVVMVFGAKALGVLLKRPQDHYDD